MRIAAIVVRVLLGLLLLFSSISYLFHLFPEPVMTGNLGIFMNGLKASGYLLYLVKVTELLCGLAFVIGIWVPLATVIIFPITLNIVLLHLFLIPNGLGIGLGVFIANLFLAYVYKDRYEPLFKMK